VTNRAAVTDPREVAQLLRAIDDYRGHSVVEAAFKLAPLVFVSPGELRAAEWSEIDLEAGEWRSAAHRTKMRPPHLVFDSQRLDGRQSFRAAPAKDPAVPRPAPS